jgi:hypothetical protein
MTKHNAKADTHDRDRFSANRKTDDRDELVARLQAKVGQLTMDDELLGQKCRQMESGRPAASRMRST